jgi:tetratricopeptide (TPR) repeat protein
MPVEGANRYKVRVSGAGVSGEPEFVSTTEIVYSGEPLERGESYLLTVEADIGEEPASATFIPIAQEKAQRLRDAAEQLAQTDLTDEEQALALANLYIGQGLIPDAIDLLEPIAKRGSQMAAIYYTLGELYAAVELLEPAEEYYSQAVELAASANNLEGQATAAARLGEICAVRGNSDMAKRWFEKALAGYKALGDRQRVQELEQKQRKLETVP